jgi:mono/diheme cytochrome c family protein
MCLVAAIFLTSCAGTPSDPPDDPVIKHGKYLAENVVTCVQCHSENNWEIIGAPPIEPLYAGKSCPVQDSNPAARDRPGARMSKLCTPNITQDPQTGIAGWSKAEIINAFRDGVRRDGAPLFPIMWLNLHAISDVDANAIATYIQTLAPVVHEQPGRGQAINKKLHDFVLDQLPPSPAESPDAANEVEYGRYLADIARCRFCHTPRDAPGQSQPEKAWTGGARYRPPGGVVYSTNLTTHAEGIGTISREEFIASFRAKGSRLEVEPKNNTVMPWVAFSGMTDEDLGSIWAFLQTLTPKPSSISPDYEL